MGLCCASLFVVASDSDVLDVPVLFGLNVVTSSVDRLPGFFEDFVDLFKLLGVVLSDGKLYSLHVVDHLGLNLLANSKAEEKSLVLAQFAMLLLNVPYTSCDHSFQSN